MDPFTILQFDHGIFNITHKIFYMGLCINLLNPPKSSNLLHPAPRHMDTILIFKHIEWVRLLKQWVGLRGGRDMDHGQHGAASDEGDPWHVLTYKANLVDPL